MDILDLLSHSIVLFWRWLPVPCQVVDQFQSLHKVVQLYQNTNIFLWLIVHDVYVNLWRGIPFLLFLFLLVMSVPHLFDHAGELHHVHRSSCDLSRDHVVFIAFPNKVLLNDTQKLRHIGVWLHHILKSLHLIQVDQLLLQECKLIQLLRCHFSLL